MCATRRAFGVIRASLATLFCVAIALPALAAPPVQKTTVLFDFEGNYFVSDSGDGVDPVFTYSQNGFEFTLSHTRAPLTSYGNAQWLEPGDSRSIPFSGQGSMRLTKVERQGGPNVPVSATVHFSEAIGAITLKVRTAQRSSATIRPILAPDAPPQPAPSATVINTNGAYGNYLLAAGGPYIGLELWASKPDVFYWDNLSATPDEATTLLNFPTSQGSNVNMVNLKYLRQVGKQVVADGLTNVYICVGRDPRETLGAGGWTYQSDYLTLAELAGTGSCTGSLPGIDQTWESLLAQSDLRIAPWYRSYIGRYGDEEGAWLTGTVVRSTAEFNGPLAGLLAPDLIDYAGYQAPGCDTDLAWRVIDVGGPNRALDEWPNVEGDRMIPDAAQCNAPGTLARRTLHVFPVRVDPAQSPNVERIHVQWQSDGLNKTLNEARGYLSDSTPVDQMNQLLSDAHNAFTQDRYADAIAAYEAIAFVANGPGFCEDCPIEANYPGNIMARAITAAFTIHDRWLHRDSYQVYLIPAELEIPLLRCDDPGADCYQYQ